MKSFERHNLTYLVLGMRLQSSMIFSFICVGFRNFILMQSLGLEYKYLAVWICKYTEEDFTSKRLM